MGRRTGVVDDPGAGGRDGDARESHEGSAIGRPWTGWSLICVLVAAAGLSVAAGASIPTVAWSGSEPVAGPRIVLAVTPGRQRAAKAAGLFA